MYGIYTHIYPTNGPKAYGCIYIYILRYCSYHKIQWRYTDLVNSSMASRWEMPRTMLRNGGSNAGKIVTLW